jgi:hypothetical protein
MHPQQMAPPTREQVITHLNAMIASRVVNLTCYEKQKRSKRVRFDIAVMDFQAVPPMTPAMGIDGRSFDVCTNVAYKRAELEFEASQLEFEASTGQLDLMIEQTKIELQQLSAQLKQVESNIVDPRSVGVVM